MSKKYIPRVYKVHLPEEIERWLYSSEPRHGLPNLKENSGDNSKEKDSIFPNDPYYNPMDQLKEMYRED